MYDIIENILKSRRSAARYVPLLSLVEKLEDNGYGDSLNAITALNDSAVDPELLLNEVEMIITGSATNLLRRMGISLYPIEKELVFVNSLIGWILIDIDNYGNVDELMDVLEADEPDIIKLALLTSLFTGKDHFQDIELIEAIEPRFMKVIYENVVSRKNAEENKVESLKPVDRRMHMFLTELEPGQVRDVFDDGGYGIDRLAFINQLDIDLEVMSFEERVNAYANLVTGIQLAYSDNYDDAIEVHETVELIVEDADLAMTMRIAALAVSRISEDYYSE